MEIKQAQEKVKELLGDIEHPRLASFIALTEEVGEVANEVMKKEVYGETQDLDALKAEVADVFLCIVELANVYGFDLSDEVDKKFATIEPRAEKWKEELGDTLQEKRDKLD